MCAAVNASELFCMALLANIECFLYHSNLSFLNIKIHIHVNSSAWADKDQLKYEKVCFLSEMSESKSRWVIFNL